MHTYRTWKETKKEFNHIEIVKNLNRKQTHTYRLSFSIFLLRNKQKKKEPRKKGKRKVTQMMLVTRLKNKVNREKE